MDFKEIKKYKPKLIEVRTRLEYIKDKYQVEDYIYTSLVDKMSFCCEHSTKAKCKKCGVEYHNGTSYCNQRLCPVCARRKSLKYMAVLMPIFETLMKRNYIGMLNFTIPDCADLKENISNLEKSWRYMTHDCKFTSFGFKKLIAGGIRKMEIKKGANSKMWHSHYHCLILKSKFCKDFEILKAYWKNATKYIFGKEGSIDIRTVKLKNSHEVTQINSKESLKLAIAETVKYITKFNFEGYFDNDLIDLVTETYNKRFVNGFGILSKYQKDFANADKLNEDEAKEKICKHCHCTEFEIEELLTDLMPEDIEEFEKRGKHGRFTYRDN